MTISILSVMCATLVVALLMQRAKAGRMTIQVLEKDVDISAHANADVGAILQSSQHFEKDES
jgi:preprotein translocase subunit SecG